MTGANGAGKTTLLQVLSGELELDGDDKRMGPGITMSRRLTVGMLKQGVFTRDDRTVEEELEQHAPVRIPLNGNGLNMNRNMTGFSQDLV